MLRAPMTKVYSMQEQRGNVSRPWTSKKEPRRNSRHQKTCNKKWRMPLRMPKGWTYETRYA